MAGHWTHGIFSLSNLLVRSNLATPTITEDHCAAGLTGMLAFGILAALG